MCSSVILLILAQTVLLILFVCFGVYGKKDDAEKYPMFQDVHVMIFFGFGFLMTFLKRYGYSSVGFTFLLGSFTVQWAVLCQGFYNLNGNRKMEIGIESIYQADIAAAAVLISMGAVLGRASYSQLIVMSFIEITAYSANSYLGSNMFKVEDVGGSIFVHTFGAYFGLAVSFMIKKNKEGGEETKSSLAEANYISDLFAMLGTIFLWLFWPSFNAIELEKDDQKQRAIVNTYLAMASCCVSAFAVSLIANPDRKFDMVHVQNSTLAGGVAVGAAANLMLQPFGAVIIGIIAGSISVFGYTKISPILDKVIPDTCGVHNLHGMPGVLSGLISGGMAALASESVYGKGLYEIYPARTGRNAQQQAGYQVISLIATLVITVVSGLVTAQTVLFILFGCFAVYGKKYDAEKYPMFQDVHVMIFIGFGFLMAFLKRYGYSSVGFTFLLGSFTVQWAVLCQGFYNLNGNYKIELGIESIYRADIAAAAVLISMGAVLGRTSYIQLMVMAFIEITAYSANFYLGTNIFQAADVGGSIFVHTFGAYFGLAVSYVINRKKEGSEETRSSLLESNYISDLFAMLGTIFLWLFWPSFNAIELKGDDQHRAVINTYLALASCCVSAFAASLIFNSDRKFNMVHVQNSTLAGGVAVGATANLMLQPYGAVIIGIIAGSISVFGYTKISPILEKACNIPDTCGVHNLHGMPGVLAGLISGVMAALASESVYDKSLYEIYPARASLDGLNEPEYHVIPPGLGRSAGQQAGYQVISLIVTLVIAVVSGFVTGLILTWNVADPLRRKHFFDDSAEWSLPRDKIFDPSPLLIFNPYYNKEYKPGY